MPHDGRYPPHSLYPRGEASATCRPPIPMAGPMSAAGGLLFNHSTAALTRDLELWMHTRAWAVHWNAQVVEHPDRAFTRRFGFSLDHFPVGHPADLNSRVRILLVPYWFLVAAA